MPKRKEPSSSLTLFKEMCDLMFEIAEKDDDCQNNKSNYLNKHIARWIYPKEKQYSKRINSTSRQRTCTLPPPPAPRAPKPAPGPFCYRCALPLYPGHSEHYEGVHATCRYCNTKGHVKAACDKLGNLPEKNYNSTSKKNKMVTSFRKGLRSQGQMYWSYLCCNRIDILV